MKPLTKAEQKERQRRDWMRWLERLDAAMGGAPERVTDKTSYPRASNFGSFYKIFVARKV